MWGRRPLYRLSAGGELLARQSQEGIQASRRGGSWCRRGRRHSRASVVDSTEPAVLACRALTAGQLWDSQFRSVSQSTVRGAHNRAWPRGVSRSRLVEFDVTAPRVRHVAGAGLTRWGVVRQAARRYKVVDIHGGLVL